MARPDVFFHVGLGRAASRWLQEQVFPHFRGVRYVPRTQFRRSGGIVARASGRGEGRPVLVSRQLGHREFLPSVEWFAGFAPHARPILVLRRHDEWLRSVYLREIKELRHVPFADFIDFEGDRGVRPQRSASFRHRIEVLERHFTRPPLVLFFDRLREDGRGFVRGLAGEVGATFDEAAISFRPTNRSYRDRQYRLLRALGQRRVRRAQGHDVRVQAGGAARRWLRMRRLRLAWHVGVALGRVVPERLLSDEPLLSDEELDRARAFYDSDWQWCVDYAERAAPR